MAQQNDDQPNSENHDWQSVAGEFAGSIASRHAGMAERIVAHVTAPIQRVALAAKSFYPRLARKIAGKAGWSGAFVSRVSALSDRISRAVQLAESEREPIERVWFDREQGFGPEFVEEGTLPSPETPPRAAEAGPTVREARAEQRPLEVQPARTRVTAPSTKQAAPSIQRSAIAKTIRFAAAKQSRLERTPLVGFSRPMIESMGIFPSKPPAEERGVPMPSSREELEMPLKHAPTIERTSAPAPSGEIPAISRAVETGIRHESPSEIAARPSATVPRYLKRIQAPFSPESIRSSLIARKPSFESIFQKKPVSIGFTPPPEAIETEPHKPPIMKELALKPQTRRRIPASESRVEAPAIPTREPAAPTAPMRKRIEPTPAIEHLARKPLVEAARPPSPQRPRAIIEEIGTKEPPAPIARAVAPAFKPSEPGIAPTVASAFRPSEPTQPSARDVVTERPSEEPAEQQETIARAMVPEPTPPVIEEHKPPGAEMAEPPIQATIEPATPVQLKAENESVPSEERPEEPGVEEGLAETIARKYEPQEAGPRIMEKPLPSVSRPREERPSPEEAFEETRAPSLAESILSKYEPPKGVRRTEEAPLPVSTQRDFEMYTSSAIGEGILRKASETGAVPEALPFAEGVPQLSPSLQPKRAIMRKPMPGAGETFTPFEIGIPGEIGAHRPVPLPSYIQTAPAQPRLPEARQEGAYKLPELVLAPIGPRARAEEESSRHIARAAEDRAATSATGTAGGEGQSGEQAPGEGPDTEAIAREVYAIIRRRLTVERERIGRRNL